MDLLVQFDLDFINERASGGMGLIPDDALTGDLPLGNASGIDAVLRHAGV